MLDRQFDPETQAPPVSPSEQMILAFLLCGGSSAEFPVNLEAEDFETPAHRAIWQAVEALKAQSVVVDFDLVMQQIESSGDAPLFRSVGGVESYLAECCARVVTFATIPYHAQQIAGRGDLRRLRLAMATLQRRLGDTSESAEDLIALAGQAFVSLPNRKRGASIEGVKSVMKRVIGELESRIGEDQVLSVRSGFPELDALTGGFQPKDFVIVAARPAMGKTAFAVQVAANVAENKTDAALIFEFEMDSTSLLKRLLSARSSVPSSEFRSGKKVDGSTLARIQYKSSALVGSDLSFVSRSACKISELRSIAQRWRVEHAKKRGVIVVDYLQLVHPDRVSKEPNETRDVGEVSRALKALAVELDVTVIALAQLNRGLESRADKRPMMSDLRSSGQMEQDADVIAFLYRDEYYTKEKCQEPGVCEVIVGKNRNGETGTVKLGWRPIYTRFEELRS